MKFSLGFEVQLTNPTPEREHQLLHDCVEQAIYVEKMGFHRIWAPEHHSLKWYAHMSAPEIFLTWVAAKTTTIQRMTLPTAAPPDHSSTLPGLRMPWGSNAALIACMSSSSIALL